MTCGAVCLTRPMFVRCRPRAATCTRCTRPSRQPAARSSAAAAVGHGLQAARQGQAGSAAGSSSCRSCRSSRSSRGHCSSTAAGCRRRRRRGEWGVGGSCASSTRRITEAHCSHKRPPVMPGTRIHRLQRSRAASGARNPPLRLTWSLCLAASTWRGWQVRRAGVMYPQSCCGPAGRRAMLAGTPASVCCR
jgi:hypothetical protein